MKRINKLIALTFIFAAAVFTSCHDNIYDMIDKEVSLEKNGLNGDIKIIRFGDYLIACNGEVFYKTAQPSSFTRRFNKQWEKTSKPSSGTGANDMPDKAAYIASDENYMYAVVKRYGESGNGYTQTETSFLYYTDDKDPTDGISWTRVDMSGINPITWGARTVFDNQFVDISINEDKSYSIAYTKDYSVDAQDNGEPGTVTARRNAYVRMMFREKNDDGTLKAYRAGIFKLNGGTPLTYDMEISNGTNGIMDGNSVSAVCLRGVDFFSPYSAFAANDKYFYFSQTRRTTSTGSDLYYGDSWSIKWKENEDGTRTIEQGKYYLKEAGTDSEGNLLIGKRSPDAHGILSIACAGNGLLLGTTKGIEHIRIDSNKVPASDTYGFHSNGGSIITEYVWHVFTLNPNLDEDSTSESSGTDEYACSTIYGSISSSSDPWSEAGLFSYYPGRNDGEWNRDGTDDDDSNGN